MADDRNKKAFGSEVDGPSVSLELEFTTSSKSSPTRPRARPERRSEIIERLVVVPRHKSARVEFETAPTLAPKRNLWDVKWKHAMNYYGPSAKNLPPPSSEQATFTTVLALLLGLGLVLVKDQIFDMKSLVHSASQLPIFQAEDTVPPPPVEVKPKKPAKWVLNLQKKIEAKQSIPEPLPVPVIKPVEPSALHARSAESHNSSHSVKPAVKKATAAPAKKRSLASHSSSKTSLKTKKSRRKH